MLARLKTLAVLGSGSLATLLIGLVSVKIWATLGGPAGFGLLGLLQGAMTIIGALISLNVGNAVVRLGARALAQGDAGRYRALQTAAHGLTAGFWALGFCALVALRGPVAAAMLGGAPEREVWLLGLTIYFNMAAGLPLAFLNAQQAIKQMARLAVLNGLAWAALSTLLLWAWGHDGIGAVLLAGTIANWALANMLYRRSPGPAPAEPPSRAEVARAAKDMLAFGAPLTASTAIGAGVMLALPLLVLNHLNTTYVGLFRAACTLSDRYFGVVLTALTQDFYPRVSAASGDAEGLSALVNEQLRLVLMLVCPLVFGMIACAGWIVPIVYAPAFMPMVGVLEWQMVGNLFHFTAWAIAYAVLAHCPGRVYFLMEAAGALITIGAHWAGLRLGGFEGLGFAAFASHAAYFALSVGVLARQRGFRLEAANQRTLVAAVGAALAVEAMPLAGLGAYKPAVALGLALGAGALGAGMVLQAWRRQRALQPA